MQILFDSNALFDDPLLEHGAVARVLEILEPAHAVLLLSPVVEAELRRHYLDQVNGLSAAVESRLKRLARLAGNDVTDLLEQTREIQQNAAERWAARWQQLSREGLVERVDWPEITARELAERELARRRPFLEKDAGTVGQRDALIWLSVLEAAVESGEAVVFVTMDKGFLEKDGGLHPHLTEELRSSGVGGQVTRTHSFAGLIPLLVAELETSGWEEWRASAVEAAISDGLRDLAEDAFAPFWDPREGAEMPPQFDIGLPPTGNDWTIMYAEGPTALVMGTAPYGSTKIDVEFTADVGFDGFMAKSEWYADDHPGLDLWDADWNESLASVEAHIPLRVRATVSIDDRSQRAELSQLDAAERIETDGPLTIGR